MVDLPSIAQIAPMRLGRVVEASGRRLRVTGFPYGVGSLARVRCGAGVLEAELVAFEGATAVLMPLSADVRLEPGALVEPWPSEGVGTVAALLGRVVDALGRPVDRRGRITRGREDGAMPLAAVDRGRVVAPFVTGVRVIDALLTMGEGQRIVIAAPAGAGKTMLVEQILRSADADVAVVALVGERGREVTDFAALTMTGAAAARTVIVAATSDEAAALRLRAALRATAIAEAFRAQGKRVLLVVDSLTRVAQAQREIGLALGEAAAINAYPPSAFAAIPRLVERAGVDRRSGGSITAIYTALAEAGDKDDPVVDAARAATDGHIVLSTALAESGVFPAVDIGRSLSRVMRDVADPEHIAAAARVRRLASLIEENRDLALMGAYAAGSDPEIDAALAFAPRLMAFVAQPWTEPCEPTVARDALFELAQA